MTNACIYGTKLSGGRGGWAAYVEASAETPRAGAEYGTAPRMQLLALTAALEATQGDPHVSIYTTSSYITDNIDSRLVRWRENGWMTAADTPVKNSDLWHRIDELLDEVGRTVEIHLVDDVDDPDLAPAKKLAQEHAGQLAPPSITISR